MRRRVWVSLPRLDAGLLRAIRVGRVSARALREQMAETTRAMLAAGGLPARVTVRRDPLDTPHPRPPRYAGNWTDGEIASGEQLIVMAGASVVDALSHLAMRLAVAGELRPRGRLKR